MIPGEAAPHQDADGRTASAVTSDRDGDGGTAWDAALDRYEAGLHHHEAVLSTGEPALGPAPWPPAELPSGPVPDALRPRAQLLLARTVDLARRLSMARESLPPLPTGARSAHRSGPPSARRFDRAL